MRALPQQVRLCGALVTLILTGTILPAELLADAGDDQYTVAASHYAAQRWELAVDEFAVLLRDHAEHRRTADALFFRGEALMQLRRYEEATESFHQLLRRDPDHRYARQAMFRRGEAAHLSGGGQAAADHLQAFVDHYGDDELIAYALPYLAATRLELEDRDAAVELYQQAVARFPTGPLAAEATLRLGVLLYERDKLESADEALARFDDQLAGRPLANQARYWRGMIALRQGQLDEATTHFDTALNAEPNGPWADDALLGKLRVAAAAGDGESIQALSTSFHERFPQSPLTDEALDVALRFRQSQQDYDGVVALLRPRIDRGTADDRKLDPRRFQLAMAYIASGELDNGLALLDTLSGTAEGKLLGDVLVAQAAVNASRGDHAAAIRPLTRYLAVQPNGEHAARCLAQLAVCQFKLGEEAAAIARYNALAEDYSDDPLFLPTTLELAELALRSDNPAWAKQLFERLAVATNPPRFVARGIAGQAWCACFGDDLEASALAFKRLLDEFPDDPLAAEGAMARGRVLEKLKRPEAALAMYRLVVERYPESANVVAALLRWGQVEAELGHDGPSEAAFQRILEEHGEAAEVAEARYSLAWMYLEHEQNSKAIAQFRELHQHHHTSEFWADATYRLAQEAFERQAYAEAQQLATALADAQATKDMRARALYILGQVAMSTRRWTELEVPLAKLIEEFPNSPLRLPSEYWLAEAAYRRGEFDLARQRFATLAEKIDDRDDTWLGMVPLRQAQIHAQKKEWAAAEQVARTIEATYPEFTQRFEADYLIGRALAAQGKFNDARRAYEKVTSAAPDKGGRSETAAMAQWMIGESYLHQKDYDAAIRAYLRVPPLYAYPRWQAAALLQAGKCHEYRTEWQQAVELYERVEQEFPNTMFAAEVAERLEIARRHLRTAAK
ncbi:MAG: tetratricopeptide repeat protein [Planctomycetota bacterium]|nr:MAG: tetratricopeptide repeat protein [Planctomycetota bacterium]REK47878.1 MAG: tetratricopeptide repeat protein [Planctomycetota bacterium]